MSDFKTQADVWRHLLESEKNKIESTCGDILELRDGALINERNVKIEEHFPFPRQWRKHLAPAPKREVAWFLDTEEGDLIAAIKDSNRYRQFGSTNYDGWKELSREESIELGLIK